MSKLKISEMKTVAEIASIYGVTKAGVHYWIKNGLEFETRRVIGVKAHKVIDPKDVDKYLGLTE